MLTASDDLKSRLPGRARLLAFAVAALVGLIWLLFLPAMAGAQEPVAGEQPPLVFTLEKAISTALERNRDILVASQDRSRADAQIREARSGALPSLDFSGSFTRNIDKSVLFLAPNTPFNPSSSPVSLALGSNNAYSWSVSLSQTLYNRKIGIALDIAKAFRDYAQEAYRGTQQSVTLAVKEAFYGVLLTQKLVEANRQGLEIVQANLENVQSQYRNGMVAEYDLLRAEVEVANTEPLLVSAENNLQLAKNSLKDLLTLPLEQDIVVEGEFAFQELPASVMEQATNDAIAKNPQIRQLVLAESMQKMNISVEHANYFPVFSLSGGYTYQTEDNTFDFGDYQWARTSNVGLSVSLPLFDGFRTGARVAQARSDYEKARFARLKAEEAVRMQMESAALRMAEAKKRIQGQEKSIDQARKAVHIAQTRFSNGVGTQLELLDSQVALTRAQTNYAVAVYDYLVAEAQWQYTVGLAQ